MKTLHFHISGLVQGVGYRWAMVAAASRLGLDGWVRNRRDGTVEAVVAGPAAAVEELIARCHAGPPGSAVATLVVAGGTVAVAPGFVVLPTA